MIPLSLISNECRKCTDGLAARTQFGNTDPVTLHVREIADATFEESLMQVLQEAGFNPRRDGGTVRLSGVGVTHQDQSVNLEMRLLEMDGHRVLALQAPIGAEPATFELASLACVRGSGACQLAKIDLIEIPEPTKPANSFRIVARFHLFADHLSAEELRVMLYLFLKEVDEIDNELVAIMAGN
jgi:hypothetical protein